MYKYNIFIEMLFEIQKQRHETWTYGYGCRKNTAIVKLSPGLVIIKHLKYFLEVVIYYLNNSYLSKDSWTFFTQLLAKINA